MKTVPIFQMHLTLILLAVATIQALPNLNSHEGALFTQQGYLIGGLSWAHITAPINISRMAEDVQGYQQLVDYFDTLSKPLPGSSGRGHMTGEERKRMLVLKRICSRRLEKMNSVIKDLRADLGMEGKTRTDAADHQIPSQNSIIRHRRQIVVGLAAVGGLIVGAITGSLFSQFKTTALIDVLNKKVDTVVHQVDVNTIGIYQDHADIKEINSTLSTFENLIGKLIATDTTYEHYFAGVYSTLLLEEQSERFALAETAIDQLLMGKLHKGLISPKGLNEAIEDLRKRALDQGLFLGVKKPLELYQLHTSFLYDQTTDIIHAVVHVPMYRESHVLTLKRYVPIPFLSPGLDRFIQINSDQNYIAQSSDGTLVKMMTETDLNACLNIGHAYFCEDHALEKPSTPNCLLQLSQGIQRQELDLCDVHVLPQVSSIYQTKRDEYIISMDKQMTLIQTCQRTSTSQKVAPGTYKLTVNPNCTTTSDHWVIYPTLQIEDANINTTTNKYDFEIQDLHTDIDQRDLQTLHSLIAAIGKPVPLAQMTQLLKFRKEIDHDNTQFKFAHFLWSGGSSFLTLMTIMTCITAGYYTYRCACMKRTRHQPLNNYEAVPMMPMPQAPPAQMIIAGAPPAAPATPARNQVVTGSPESGTADATSRQAPIFQFGSLLPSVNTLKGSGSLSS